MTRNTLLSHELYGSPTGLDRIPEQYCGSVVETTAFQGQSATVDVRAIRPSVGRQCGPNRSKRTESIGRAGA